MRFIRARLGEFALPPESRTVCVASVASSRLSFPDGRRVAFYELRRRSCTVAWEIDPFECLVFAMDHHCPTI